jgi:acetyl-CoA acetyltransferase
MSLKHKTAIVGAYEHPTRFAPDKTSFQIMAESLRGALDHAGLTIKDIDGISSCGMMGGMGMISFCDYINLQPNYIDSTSVGGASFLFHVAHAAAAVHAGLCAVCAVVFGSTVASRPGGGMGGGLSDPCDQYEVPFGVTTVNAYAMIAQRHMHDYGTTPEQLAEIAVTTRMHASMNPVAKYREPITIDDVLASRYIATPLHLLDCCIISDGGGAVIVTSEDRARGMKKPVYILGAAETARHTSRGKRDFLELAAAQSGKLAFERAGVTHKDIDMGMIYDSFTITVLATLENLGFCKRGEGGAFVQGGRLRFDGDFPINTDGGGLSSCHPMMRGMFLLIEATKQLRGECGPRQVKECKTALCHGTGGALGTRHSGATIILSNQ